MLNSKTVITSFFIDDVNKTRHKVIGGVRYTAELHQVSPVTNIDHEYHYISTLNVSSSENIHVGAVHNIACGSTGVSIPCALVTSKDEKGKFNSRYIHVYMYQITINELIAIIELLNYELRLSWVVHGERRFYFKCLLL